MMDTLLEVLEATVKVAALICSIILTAFFTFLFVWWIISGFEYKTWNELHGTKYTRMQWFSGADFIKAYHYPGREETKKNEINLNVN